MAVTVSLELELPGVDGTVLECRIVEALSRPTCARLLLRVEEGVAPGALVGREVHLGLALEGRPVRAIALIVTHLEYIGADELGPRYAIELRSALWQLTLTKNTRKFRDLAADAIVSRVLGEASLAHVWQLSGSLPSRPYTTQYRESNLAFIDRLLEHEGVYYVHEDDGSLRFEDRSSSAPPIEGRSHFELQEQAMALEQNEPGVRELWQLGRLAPGKVTVSDYDWKHPSIPLLRTAQADRDTELEHYDYLSGYRSAGEGERLARLRLEAYRAEARNAEGVSTVPTFTPGRAFSFGADAGEVHAGEYVLTRVEHVFAPVAGQAGALAYQNNFGAVARNVPYRPLLVTPRPRVAGHHTATVVGPAGSEIHTDVHGRCKVRFHWDREATGTDADSRWLRVAQESAWSSSLARVGWEVNVGYVDGDPDRPLVVGRQINGVMTPSYEQPGHKNRMTIKSATSPATGGYNEIRLDDSAGAMSFDVRAERSLKNIVGNDLRETIAGSFVHDVGAALSREVAKNQTVSIGGSAATSCGAEHRTAVTGDQLRAVGGSETVLCAAGSNVSAGGNQSESCSMRITVAKGIRRSAETLFSRDVGAAQLVVAGRDVITRAGGPFAETIGGAKLTIACKGGVTHAMNDSFALTVGGASFEMAKFAVGSAAKRRSVRVGLLAKFTAGEKLEIHCETFELVGKSAVKLDGKDACLHATPSGVTMKGDVLLKAGDKVIVSGRIDNITGAPAEE